MTIQEKIDSFIEIGKEFREKNPECNEVQFTIREIPYSEWAYFVSKYRTSESDGRASFSDGRKFFIFYPISITSELQITLISVPVKITEIVEELP